MVLVKHTYIEVDMLRGFAPLLGAFASCPLEFAAALTMPKIPYSLYLVPRQVKGGWEFSHIAAATLNH